MYNINEKCFDEPHSPIKLREVFANYENASKKKFFNELNMYSYFLQCKTIHECLEGEGKILEIGPGGNIVRDFMRTVGYSYETLDPQDNVHPDIKCDIKDFHAEEYKEQHGARRGYRIY